MMETTMADVPVEVKKAPAAEAPVPDVWRSFRSEMDRLFDQFGSGFGFPSLRRMFDLEPVWRSASSFTFSAPAIDMSEDEKAYKISAELPGLDAKDVDVSMSGNTLVLKGEKRQKKEEKEKNYYLSERAYGSFQRTFELPPSIDRDKVSVVQRSADDHATENAGGPKAAEENRGQSRLMVRRIPRAASIPLRLGAGEKVQTDKPMRKSGECQTKQESHWSLQSMNEA
jgi:HSP20 family protein